MSKKANPAAVGLFVIIGIILAAVGIIVLGAGSLFEESQSYVLYFEGDLGGLDVGAPVTFKGVKIGQVSGISLVYDHQTQDISMPVNVKVMKNTFIEKNQTDDSKSGHGMKVHISRGLRARLETQSMVTGKLKVALDYFPKTEAVYCAKGVDDCEIPTVPGTLDSIAKRIESLPLEQIVLDFHKTSEGIAKIVSSGKLNNTVDELNKILLQVSDLVNSQKTQNTMFSIDETLKETQVLMKKIGLSADPMRREFLSALSEFADAARAVEGLVEYLERHPESLLHGKGKE